MNMAHTFAEKVAQRAELMAAYERADELESALRRAMDVLNAIRDGQYHEDIDDVLPDLNEVLEDRTILAPSFREVFHAVFGNGI